ncbi:MAG: hypothetical protein EPO27_07125 [Betaproteobacteria bacterium]|nr:MAG: hypothetical protein EPO27_07125 [Betaproteobacteria bacterium]
MNRKYPVAVLRQAFALAERERKFLLRELTQVRGLMPLLMKPRNKQRWTPQDKAEIRAQLRRLSNLSPYFVALVMPGGFVVLPALTWWLDRRRARRGLAPTHSG